jgi:hypothetical protein
MSGAGTRRLFSDRLLVSYAAYPPGFRLGDRNDKASGDHLSSASPDGEVFQPAPKGKPTTLNLEINVNNMTWEVLETTKRVSEMSRNVHIDRQALDIFVGKLSAGDIKVPSWDTTCHFFDGTEKTVAYLLVLDTINFCFWPPQGKAAWEIDYKSKSLSGYYALAASLKRAVESGIPILEAEYLVDLSPDQLKQLFQGRGEIQLLENRLAALNELGHILIKEYDGHAHRLIESAGYSALNLARLLAVNLRSFNDMAEYQGRRIFFYKRAQIIAADLYGAFNGKNWGRFTDMDKTTAFADYKLPQVLRHLGILRYTDSLAQKIDQGILIDSGGPEEIEIRANTIQAVELLRRECAQKGKALMSFEIDWLLWNLGQDNKYRKKPYHRTLTIFY